MSYALLTEREWPAGRRPLDILQPVLRVVTGPAPIATKFCQKQHPNNPDSDRCIVCQIDLSSVATIVDMTPRPVARLLLEDGTSIDVADQLVIGRSPESSAVSMSGAVSETPFDRLSDTLTVTGRQVSRVHLVLEVEGWQLLVRDADSTNGTFLARRGERGRRRIPTETSVPVQIGDSIQFGSRQALVVHAR